MARNETELYIASLISGQVGVAPVFLLAWPPDAAMKFIPGIIFTSRIRALGHPTQIDLQHPRRINSLRSMIKQNTASFPNQIAVVYQPETSQRALVGSASRDCFIFLVAYQKYYVEDDIGHGLLYAFLNPDVLG